MKKLFKKLPIKYKIITLNLIILIPSILISTGLIAYQDIKTFKKQNIEAGTIDAKLLGELSTSYVSFGFKRRLFEFLPNLKYNNNIKSLFIYDVNKKLFIDYKKDSLSKEIYIPFADTMTIVFSENYLMINFPLKKEGKLEGYLKINKYTGYYKHIKKVLYLSIIIFIIVTLVALAAITVFQRIITDPILKLAKISAEIAEKGSYEIAVHTDLKDEIAVLYHEFNQMLKSLRLNINQREQALFQLQKNQEILLNIQKIAHIGSWRRTIKTGVLEWSDEEYLIFNLSKDNAINYETFITYIHPNDRSLLLSEWDSSIKQKKVYELEYRIIVNKQIKWLYERAEIIYDENSQAKYGEGFSYDITKRKLQELEILDHRNNLEEIVRTRTNEVIELYADITFKNEELNKANLALETEKKKVEKNSRKLFKAYSDIQQKAEELENTLNKLKNTQSQLVEQEKMASLGVLTAGIAHEINNPVNFISSNTLGLENILEDLKSLMNQTNIEANQKMNVTEDFNNLKLLISNIKIGVDRTVEIVKSLRTFSRESEENFSAADINTNIDSTLLLLKTQTKNRIDVLKKYGKIPPIFCEIGKLNQVFLNILTNAIHAIKDTGTIEITSYTEKNYVVIKFRDNGAGIKPEIKNKIFEPFFTTKKIGKGTGLGLSISYSIIKAHKGKIKVESELGKGTIFFVYLPIIHSK